MRMSILLCALASLPGCTTVTYTSSRPRLEVAECIASGWRNAAPSGYGVPVSLTDFADYCFVGVELHANFSPLPTGTSHPTYAVWAEVRDTPSGTTTKYHRAYQVEHARIDRVVVECQGERH